MTAPMSERSERRGAEEARFVVLVFASRDAAAYTAAVELVRALGPSARLVDRLSRSLADLKLVAKYGVVESVAVVVLHGDVLVARIPRVPTLAELRADLAGLALALEQPQPLPHP